MSLTRNVQVIDGAQNSAYDIFAMPIELFDVMFPGDGQDIEFIEDDMRRHPDLPHCALFEQMWETPALRRHVNGIHGTLFHELEDKRKYHPNRRDSDLDLKGRGFVTTSEGT